MNSQRAIPPRQRHRLTVAEYHRMGAAGILGPDDRTELLDGHLIDISPIGPRHAMTVSRLARLCFDAISDPAIVIAVQNPVDLDLRSEPVPDLVVARRPSGAADAHPRPDEVLLLVEVADTSLRLDAGIKRDLYARAGIAEVWVVDLATERVLVFRDAEAGRFRATRQAGTDDVLDVAGLPGVAIPVKRIFG